MVGVAAGEVAVMEDVKVIAGKTEEVLMEKKKRKGRVVMLQKTTKPINDSIDSIIRKYSLSSCINDNNNDSSCNVNAEKRIIEHYEGRCKYAGFCNRETGEINARISANAVNTNSINITPIPNVKKLHAWITQRLIQMYTKPGDAVLDVACGKGGDLAKYEKAQVGTYVGVDIVLASLETAQQRYMSLRCTFPVSFHCMDAFTPLNDNIDVITSTHKVTLSSWVSRFDVCSCQFALHYAWSSEERARAALSNIASALKPGGYFFGTLPNANSILKNLKKKFANANSTTFGNKLYQVSFDLPNAKLALASPLNHMFGIQYDFYLADAVLHCPEWLVPLPSLTRLAREYGLQLVSCINFNRFLQRHPHVGSSISIVPNEEWDCISLYLAFAFQKR